MRSIAIGLLALLLVPAARALGDKDKPDKTGTPADELRALEQEFGKAQQAIVDRAVKAKTDDERGPIIAEMRGLGAKYAARFLQFAEKNAKDPAAVEALLWVMQNVELGKDADAAAERIIAGHLGDPKVRQNLPRFGRSMSSGAEKLLRAAAKSENAETQAVGAFALAQYLKNRSELPATLESLDEKTRKMIEKTYGREFLDGVRKIDPAKMSKEAEELFTTVEKKHADVKVNGRPLGEQVKSILFEMRHLAIGKPAPEIEGEDLDGTKFKLSDYRGKVVVLDFWGDW